MLIDYHLGQTSIVVRVKLRDSTVTTGAGKTGLTNASTGLVVAAIADNEATTTAYTSAGSTIDTITTLGTYAAPTAGHCRFKEVDATNHKGVYELQLENSRYAVSNAKSVLVSISGVTGVADCDFVIPLRGVDPYDATAFGVSRLDAAITSRSTYAGGAVASVTGSVGSVTGSVGSISGVTFPTNFAATAIDASGRMQVQYGTTTGQVNLSAGNLAGPVTAGTVSDKTGYALSAAGLDSIAVTDPGVPGNHTTLAKMLVAVYRALWKKQTMTSTQAKRYADDGTTLDGTATVSDDGTTQTVGTFS